MSQSFEALWHQTLDALVEAVWLIDEETLCIRFANRAAERLTAYDRATMQGMPVQALAATPQDLCLWEDANQWRTGSQTLTQVLREAAAARSAAVPSTVSADTSMLQTRAA